MSKKDHPSQRTGAATTPHRIIRDIQIVRARNNKLWMDILRLAFREAPKEAVAVMRQISKNDQEINKLSAELGAQDKL